MSLRIVESCLRRSIRPSINSRSYLCGRPLYSTEWTSPSVSFRRYISTTPYLCQNSPLRPYENGSKSPSHVLAAEKPGLVARARGYMEKSKAMVKQLISGTKEFVKETKEAKELKRRNVVDGYQWTRREYFLIKKNEQDFWRAIPFLFCCVFLGEAIPFLLLRGIVPSTCLTPDQVDAKVKRLAGIRKELSAAAVQSIESGKAVGGSNMTAASFLADDFVLRLAHTQPQYFHIDNLNGPQLRTFNKYLGIWKVGPAPYLKRVLRQHADYIKGDDLLLAKEGLESLTAQELKSAMDARGLPSIDVSEFQMKADLSEWVALHTTEDPEVPFGLMMLSGIVRVEKQGTFASRTHSAVESLPPPRDEAVMAA